MDAVRKLVNVDKVAIIIGEYSSGKTMPAGQWTNENKVVHISIGANSPKLCDIGPYFFSTIGLASLQGPQLVKLAKSEVGAKTLATLFPNNPYGVGVEIATCEAAPKLGLECIAKIRYEEAKTDYKPELRQLMAPNPDAVIWFAYGAEAALVLRQAYEMGIKAAEKWIGTEVSNWEPEVKDTPEIAEGLRGIEPRPRNRCSPYYTDPSTSLFTTKSGLSRPSSASRMFCTLTSLILRIHSSVRAALCGLRTTFWSSKSGLSGAGGSWRITSSPAPRR